MGRTIGSDVLKRAAIGAFCALMATSLAACGGSNSDKGNGTAAASASVAQSSSNAPSSSSVSGSSSSASHTSAKASSAPATNASATSSSARQPDATTSTPQTAAIPATCQLPAMRLSGGKTPSNVWPKGGGVATGDEGGPVLVDLARRGYKQVLWQYSCSAGNVMWPSYLILSDAKGNIVGSLDMAFAGSEHASVMSWDVSGNDVGVDWEQHNGAGFDPQTHHSLLTWKDGKLALIDAPNSQGRQRPGVPADAAPGAGGPRPANATPLTESTNASYSPEPGFKTPSGNNGCALLGNGDWRCGSAKGGEYFLTKDGQQDTAPGVDDAPMWPMPETSVLDYGQVRYSGDTVFASTTTGVTVWNTKTSHGAFINTSGITTF